ncbi:MAG: hypothetical protein V1708_04640 [Candidatus Micrarchaeota archaeon]
MILDAPTYKTVLTPEQALGIIQKELAKKGWKKPEVEDIRLIYTPFYSFSFDVAAEGSSPITGKAALNAFSGDVNEIVPMILERPLTKLKEVKEGEVEETSISLAEAREVAKDKLSVQTGVKREKISASAFVKSYIPFYRIWLSVHHEPYKAEIDALMGSLVGLEGVHEKPKSWGEATSDTINKMKTPAGWVELGGKTVGALSGAGGGHGGGHDEHGGGQGGGVGGMLANKQARWGILLLVIVALAWFMFYSQQGGTSCTGAISTLRGKCVLIGECGFNNPAKEDQVVMTRIAVYQDGKERLDLGETVMAMVSAGGKADAWRKAYNITWAPDGASCGSFSWKSAKI